jgi:fido (protein-threonine AMPylation protein)
MTRPEPQGALRQYNLILDLVERHTSDGAPKFILTPALVRQLHAAVFQELMPDGAGLYRTIPVIVRGSQHLPTDPVGIAEEVVAMCERINERWNQDDAFSLAAYALWRLSWIHPFTDGNGRTARALSYLILSIRLGFVLPGSRTIPEQLRQHRSRYFDALSAADSAFQTRSEVDVRGIEVMLREMLSKQLRDAPALSDEDVTTLHGIVDRRVRRAPAAAVILRFGQVKIAERIWALEDHLVLQVGHSSAIEQAEHLHLRTGNPFPRLLAVGGAKASVSVSADQRGIILGRATYEADLGYALAFEHSAAAVIEHPHVRWQGDVPNALSAWEVTGALYVMRYGRELTESLVNETMDLLLARHMNALG